MLKLWPNWFQPLSRTPDPGITHLCWRSVVHWAKGSHHPKHLDRASGREEGGPGEAACPFPLCFRGERNLVPPRRLSLLACTIP